jgi:PadR family transcriptional regulator PadR
LKNDGLLNYRWEESIRTARKEVLRSNRNGQTFLKELSGTWTELSDAVNLITNQKQ